MTITRPVPVNTDLVWDYDIPDVQDEAFRHWYIARVLTRGQMADIQAIGLPVILDVLPYLQLPADIRRFWEWVAALPDIRARYGLVDTPAAKPA